MKEFIVSISLIFLGLFSLKAQCPPHSENVQLLYHYDDDSAPTVSGTAYNDCWGWIDANGNEYAIMGGIDSIYAFNITNPSAAYKVDADPIPYNSLWRDFKTYDHYLYAVSDQGSSASGLLVYDLDSLASGKLHLINGYTADFTRAHNIFVDTVTAKLYVAGSNTVNKGLIIYDLSTDTKAQNPEVIKKVNFDTLINVNYNTYIHDVFVRNDTAYCSHGYSGYYIWDLTNPTNLTSSALIGSMDNTTATLGGYVHSSWNSDDNKYAVVATEVNGSFPEWRRLFVVDQTNMSAPVVDTTWKEPLLECNGQTNNVPHNPMIRNDTMFVSYYHDGLQILDFTTPTNPDRIGYYDTDTTNTNYNGYQANCGVFPFFPSGNVIASDMKNGLHVLKYVPPCPLQPDIDPIDDVDACDLYTLPVITGSNLTGNEKYYNAPGGTGNAFPAGTVVFSSGTYYAYDGNSGCGDEEVFEITIHISPTVSASPDVEICNGESTTIMATGSSGTTPYVFTWNQGLGNGQSHQVSPFTTTSYTVTITDANLCTDTDQLTVVVNPLPQPEISGEAELCEGEFTVLDAGAGFNSYSWNTGESTQTIEVSETDTYSVTVTNIHFCSNSDDFELIVHQNPGVTVSSDVAICAGDSTEISAEAFNGTAPYTYNWDQGLPEGATQIVSPPITTTYSLTVTDVNGCETFGQLTVGINPNPIAEAGTDPGICEGESTVVSASVSSGTGPFEYFWDQGLGNGQSHEVSPSVTTSYTVSVTDVLGCMDTDIVTVNVYENPAPEIQGLNLVCEGNSTVLDAGSGYSIYSWSTGETTQSISVDSENIYGVTVTDINGCVGEDEFEVFVVDSLEPQIIGALDICEGESTILDAGSGYNTYAWNTGDDTQSISVDSTGLYSVSVSDALGCSGSGSVMVTIHENPSVIAAPDITLCLGDSTQLSAEATGGSGPYSYFWDNEIGGGQSHMVGPMISTTYTVTVTDGFGCSATDEIMISVISDLAVNAGTDAEICSGTEYTIEASGSGGTEPYIYTWDQDQGDGAQHLVSPDTFTTYQVTITDANGCTHVDQLSVDVLPLPAPEITGSFVFCENSSTELHTENNFASYLWNTGEQSNSIEVAVEGIYTVTVTDINGCTGVTSAEVLLAEQVPIEIIGDLSICGDNSTYLDAGIYESYNWSNGESTQVLEVTQAGVYSVTVTDINGCTSAAEAEVIESDSLMPLITGPAAICEGSFGILDGGEGYDHYLWSTGDTTRQIEISAGTETYGVTVSNEDGCSGSTEIDITVFPAVIAETSEEAGICQGSSALIMAFANEGTSPFEYLWDQGLGEGDGFEVAPDTTTLYNVTITDANGCSDSGAVLVNVHENPDIFFEQENIEICQGEAIEINANANGGNGIYEFIWDQNLGEGASHLVSPEINTSYSVTVTDSNACTDEDQLNVIVNPSPDTTVQLLEPGILSAIQENADYQWLDCENDFAPIEGATGQDFTVIETGNYAVQISFDNCVDTSSCHLVIITNTLDSDLNSFKLYPVPSEDHIVIEFSDQYPNGANYEIISLNGQKFLSGKITSGSRIDLTALADGLYLIRIEDALQKIIKTSRK